MSFNIIRSAYGFDIGIELLAVLSLLILMTAILREGLVDRAYSRYIFWLAFFQAAALVCDSLSYMPIGGETRLEFDLIVIAASFSFTQLALLWFNFFLINFLCERTFVEKTILYPIAFFCGGAIIVYVIGMFQTVPWFFRINEDYTYEPMPAYFVLIIIPLLLFIFDAMLIISCRKGLTRTELFTWLSYEIIPILALGLSFAGLPESIYITSGAVSIILIYTNIHVVRTQKLADDEIELSESKVKLLISQMQPHFMYNTLNSIYYLIGKDPNLAKDALNTFSGYLRDNINSLRDNKTITVEEELRHIDAYLKMEKLRFGDDLTFEFDIREKDFRIPALSIQPLVENAVKHGISQKEEGGTIWISTYSDDENYYVKIKDDGVGFDAKNYKDDKASSHIGIFNVNSRIKIMCHGKLSVVSTPGKGTTSLMTIPRDGQKEYKKQDSSKE